MAETTSGRLERIDLSALGEPLRETLRNRLAQYEGQAFTSQVARRIRDEVIEVDPHLSLTWRRTAPGIFSLTLSFTMSPLSSFRSFGVYPSRPPGAEPSAATQSEPPPAEPGTPRVRVGGLVQASKLVNAPAPEYPPLARQARIQGVVRFTVVIGTDGSVRHVQVINGHPLLIEAALAAAKQYVYQPTSLNGKPVEVVTDADVNFTLPK